MRNLLFALFAVLFAFSGCSSDDPAGPTRIDDSDVQAIVDAAGKLEPLEPNDDEIIGDPVVTEEGDFRYTAEVHREVDNITDIAYLGLNDDVIWPGSLIRGNRAHDFIYDPVTVPRAALTLSVSLETANKGPELAIEVADPKLSTIRQGISDLLHQALTDDTSVGARVEFSKQQVLSKSHMSMYLDTDISYGLGDLETAFDWESTEEKTRVVAKYKQIYYSIDMDTPQNAAAMFPAGLTKAELREGMPAGSMPMYVAGVSYGMMAIMTMESTFRYESMNLAIDAAFSGTVDVEVESGFTAEQVLRDSSIRIVVYGGSTAGLQDIELDFAGLMRVINASSDFSRNTPGVPLIYKFRHLKDNTLAFVTQTSQYTLVRPLRLRQRVRITAIDFYCEMADDEGPDNEVDMDRFRLKVWAYDRLNDQVEPTPISGAQDQDVYYWSTSGEHGMNSGSTWLCGPPNSFDVTFNTEFFDFDLAQLHFWAWARDYDGCCDADENGYAELDVTGERFLENGGLHYFLIHGANNDFRFRVNFRIELVD